jgi:hypothetical protein
MEDYGCSDLVPPLLSLALRATVCFLLLPATACGRCRSSWSVRAGVLPSELMP